MIVTIADPKRSAPVYDEMAQIVRNRFQAQNIGIRAAAPVRGRAYARFVYSTDGDLKMAKKDIHVVPHDQGWATRKEGSQRAGGVYRDEDRRPGSGARQAKREHVEVVIHGKDGKIRTAIAIGRDPMPPPDRSTNEG